MRSIALLVILLLLTPVLGIEAQTTNSVDLLWQAETYTPPFYEGRALWSSESHITFVAIPHISGTDPSSLYYRWSQDGTVLGSSSGINKRSLSFSDSVLSLRTEVRVDIMPGIGKGVLASASVSLKPIVPRVIVLEKHPLYGLMFHRPVGSSFDLVSDEVTFSAIPLFAAVSARTVPALSYTWTTNNGDIRNGNTVTYRVPKNASGSSSIRLRTTNTRVLSQPQEKSFTVQFDNENDF